MTHPSQAQSRRRESSDPWLAKRRGRGDKDEGDEARRREIEGGGRGKKSSFRLGKKSSIRSPVLCVARVPIRPAQHGA